MVKVLSRLLHLGCRNGLIALLFGLALALTVPSFAVEASPRECFQSFIGATYGAAELHQVEQYFSKELRSSYKSLAGAARGAKLKELKAYYIADYKILGEKISGQTAVVTARGRALNIAAKKVMSQTDVFNYVKEGGYWRITGAQLKGVFKL